MTVSDVKPFIPAKNFEQSLKFYKELGWKELFRQDNLAELEIGNHRFFLQDYYVRAWANNSMLYINVDNAQSWHEKISMVLKEGKFGPARVRPPELQDYGDLVTFAWDPSGVLLHFAEMQ